jgi:lysozyme
MIIADVRSLIKYHEGLTLVAKPDAKGKWAYGYGHDIPAPSGSPPSCTEAEAEVMLDADLALATHRAAADVTTWISLDDVRRAVLIDMAYEIGGAGLAGFHNMLAALQDGHWQEATEQLIYSLLYKEVPTREAMNAQMLLTGQWPHLDGG